MAEYTQERNEAFMRECDRQMRKMFESGEHLRLREVTARAAAAPAPSYYLSYNYAYRMVSTFMRNGAGMGVRRPSGRSDRRAMVEELVAKCRAEMVRDEDLTLGRALTRVLASEGASSYFMTPAYALRLYHKLQNQWKFRSHRRRRRTLF